MVDFDGGKLSLLANLARRMMVLHSNGRFSLEVSTSLGVPLLRGVKSLPAPKLDFRVGNWFLCIAVPKLALRE